MNVNGNRHLAKADLHEYDTLKVVVESPDANTVRVTVYRGDDPTPLSTETYGNDSEQWNKNYPQYELCKCGHQYHRHFDSYENWAPSRCKYCPCDTHDKA